MLRQLAGQRLDVVLGHIHEHLDPVRFRNELHPATVGN